MQLGPHTRPCPKCATVWGTAVTDCLACGYPILALKAAHCQACGTVLVDDPTGPWCPKADCK